MKWLLRLFGLLLLIVAIFVAGVLMLPGDRIAQVAVDQIRAQTGRAVILKGETEVSYYPVLGVSTGAIEIANADWSETGPFMVADSLKVGVDLMSLIGGEVRITGLEAVNPSLLFERSADGRENWRLGVEGVAPSGVSSGSSNALALSLDRALISGGRLRYLDHAGGSDLRFEDVALDLRWPEYHGGATFTFTGRRQGSPLLTISGEVSDLAAMLEGREMRGQVEAVADGGTLRFEGDIGAPGQLFSGILNADLPNSGNFMAALGIGGVDLPQGLGRRASAEAEVTLTDRMALSLRDLRLSLDQNTLNGDLELDLAPETPQLMARFSAGTLDFAGLSGGGGGGSSGGGGSGADGWSKAPIDASALGLFNGQISLTTQGLRVAGLSFGAASLLATIERSRAVITLNRMEGYSGTITGQVVANNRSGLSVGGAVKASGVEMQPLLIDLAGIRRFTGAAEANLEFLGVGNSIHTIINSLSGNGGLSMGRGTIEGFDLDSLMRQGLATGGTTVFDSLTASFTMDKGNLYNKDLLLKLPIVSASGEGRVGIGARDIDYLFTPKTGSAETEGGVVIPVRIQGPWSNPRIWPDMDMAIDLNLKEEKEAAKAQVEEKVKEKLGLETQQGESLEDAAKRKLEEELLKGLGGLFK